MSCEAASVTPSQFITHGRGYNAKLVYTTAEITLSNSTVINALFAAVAGKDNVSGSPSVPRTAPVWKYVSIIPIVGGTEAAVHAVDSAGELIAVSGVPGNFTQVTSHDAGGSWGKPSGNLSYASRLSVAQGNYGSTVFVGAIGHPGIVGLLTSKKTDKEIDFAEEHNKLVESKKCTAARGITRGSALATAACTPFSQEFIDSREWGDCELHPGQNDTGGCASSADMESFSFSAEGADDIVYVVYDKLRNGFTPSKDGGDHAVFIMKMRFNETEEIDQLKEEQEEVRRRKAAAEYRAKVEKQEKERRKREAEERARKLKEKKATFMRRDSFYISEAKKTAAIDGDMIVIRDVLPEFTDLEKEVFIE